ncbi:MAG: SPASM domain-containing protein [Muribaculum sp.]|nr:SPASM domain-containing protein [Muribaculum sp.]
MKEVLIFGAGQYGRDALKKLGEEWVAGFIDNSVEKQGGLYCGKPVISVEQAVSMQYPILIACENYASSMGKQLEEYGIEDYSVLLNHLHRFYETDSLIFNPYDTVQEALTEAEWRSSEQFKCVRDSVYSEVEKLYPAPPVFESIEIQTISRRHNAVMPEELFRNIVDQLEAFDYGGRFSLSSDNEPLLDDRIIALSQYARDYLPYAVIHMRTNAELLTLEKFIDLADLLDELIIDNYQQELKLIAPCVQIQEYCEAHQELKEKVTIVLRKPQEICMSGGDDGLDHAEHIEYGSDRCVLPFKQMFIRPDGKVSLCGKDAGRGYILGDLNQDKLLDIWYGASFQEVRKCLYEGRKHWGDCKHCDMFSL